MGAHYADDPNIRVAERIRGQQTLVDYTQIDESNLWIATPISMADPVYVASRIIDGETKGEVRC